MAETYPGPYGSASEPVWQVGLQAVALSAIPEQVLTAADLVSLTVLGPVPFNWNAPPGGVTGLAALAATYGVASFPLADLAAPAVIAGVAILAGPNADQLAGIGPLVSPLAVKPGPQVAEITLSFLAFDQ